MNKEKLFLNIINATLSDNSYLGDDCAYLKEFEMLVSHDSLVQDVHFKMSYFSPYEIGKKSILVNISDILSNGGEPKFLTIALSGKLDENFIKEFYRGANEICDKYKIKIIGGDLTGGDKICISICIMGSSLNRKVPSLKNAKKGDIVYLAGYHGSSAAGLKLLLNGAADNDNEFVKAHKEPVLYPEISAAVSKSVKYDYVMTDTSDGLFDALERIRAASGAGFSIDYDSILKKTSDKNLVLFGGEDFGLLICLKPADSEIVRNLELQKIGVVTDTKKIIISGEEIGEDISYRHFA